jgi:biotin carboxyl carrier protein
MPENRDGATAAVSRGAAKTASTRAPSARAASGQGLDIRAERDHLAISRLTDDVLPAIIAKLTASGLGEIEVREGSWKVRLRRPAGSGDARRVAAWNSLDGHSGQGHALGSGLAASDGRGTAEERDYRAREEREAEELASLPVVAISPAVGIYQARKDLAVGMRVRSGDRIGTVDVLGVREDVIAPMDGVIGSSLAESGEAVEYGQELIRIELAENARGLDVNGADREAAAVLGEA